MNSIARNFNSIPFSYQILTRENDARCHCPDDKVPRGAKLLYSGTNPESYITEYAFVYDDKNVFASVTQIDPETD